MLKVYMYRGRKHYFDDKTAPAGAVEVKAEEPAKAPEPDPVVEQKEINTLGLFHRKRRGTSRSSYGYRVRCAYCVEV